MRQIIVYITVAMQLVSLTVYGQRDSIQKLPEVLLSTVRLRDYNQGVITTTIDQEVVSQSRGTLSFTTTICDILS